MLYDCTFLFMGSAAEKTKLFLREENSGFVHVIFYQCAAVHVLYGTTVVSRRKQPSRHISFEFNFIKTCPPDTQISDSDAELNDEIESVM